MIKYFCLGILGCFTTLILFCLCVFFSSCSFFQKNVDGNEINQLTQEVLKKGEGVDIIVKPIPKQGLNVCSW